MPVGLPRMRRDLHGEAFEVQEILLALLFFQTRRNMGESPRNRKAEVFSRPHRAMRWLWVSVHQQEIPQVLCSIVPSVCAKDAKDLLGLRGLGWQGKEILYRVFRDTIAA